MGLTSPVRVNLHPWQDSIRYGKLSAMTSPSEARAIPEDTFAARLKLARLHAGNLTVREAAVRCGLKHESWSGWERGGKPRDLADVVERISEQLGVDRTWLLFGGPLAPEDRERRRAARVLTRERSRRLTGS